MTTDTAVRVTRIIVQDKVNVEDIPYIDHPDLKVDEHESVEMPFRYVRDEEEKPIMPEVSFLAHRLSGISRAKLRMGLC